MKFKSKSVDKQPKTKKPGVSKPPASVVDAVQPKTAALETTVPKPQAPFVKAGEWVDVLNDQHGVYTIVLDYGAFRWAWDLIENRAVYSRDYARRSDVSPEFSGAILSATTRVIDAFRDEATRHDDMHVKPVVVAPERPDKKVVQKVPLTSAEHAANKSAKKLSGKASAKADQQVALHGKMKKSAGSTATAPGKKTRSKFKTKGVVPS